MIHSFRLASPLARERFPTTHPAWFAAPPLLILALIFYCEASSLISQTPAPGLAVSGGWAVRIALGWIVVLMGARRFGPRIAALPFAIRHPWLATAVCVASIAIFTLGSEWLLSAFSTRWPSLFAFLHARLPMHLAVAALLVTLLARLQRPAGQQVDAPPAQETTIEVMTGTGHTTIRIDEIEWLRAERNYVNVMHRSGRTYLLRRTMTALEKCLDPRCFARVHRSVIVNRACIRERRPGGTLLLQSGATVRISRAYRESV